MAKFQFYKFQWYLQNIWAAICGREGYSVYCRDCGACGHEGCCHPDMCKHLHCDGYRRDYRELEADINRLEGTPHKITDDLASTAAVFIRFDADPEDIDYQYMAKQAAKYERLMGRISNAEEIEREFKIPVEVEKDNES